jgi:hypothetical protein
MPMEEMVLNLLQNFGPFGLNQNLEISDLAMAKVEKVNTTVTYFSI